MIPSVEPRHDSKAPPRDESRGGPVSQPAVDVGHRVYADFLDGTARLLRLEAAGQATPVTRTLDADADRDAVRFIKHCAIFGTTIALTEPQIIDSPVIASLFVDPQFRDFLQVIDAEQPRLFELVVHPQNNDEAYKAPLHSLTTVGWQSTPLHDSQAIVRVARQLLNAQDLESTAWDCIKFAPLQPDHLMVEGSLRALLYFRGRPEAIARPRAATRGQYYSILQSINAPAWCAQDIAEVVRALDQMDEPARYSRSRLLRQLEQRGIDVKGPGFGRTLFSTVVSAWNHAVQCAVAEEGAIALLPGSVPVPYLLGRVNDVWEPGTVARSRSAIDALKVRAKGVVAGFLRTDPTSLEWAQLQELCNRTAATRANLAIARRSSSKYNRQEATLRHYEAIAANLPEVESWVRGCLYMGISGSAGLATGGLGALGAMMLLVLQGAADWDIDLKLINRLRRRMALSTLRTLAPADRK